MTTTSADTFHIGPALLFCPADRPERYTKASERADAVIIDLEDAVGPADRPAAREHLAEYFGPGGAAGSSSDAGAALRRRIVVRINPATSADFEADLRMLAQTQVEWVMLAKAESAQDVAAAAEGLPGAAVLALCETPRGVASAAEIAAHPATAGLMWGAEDLVAALGGTSSRRADGEYRDVARLARAQVLLAAGAFGKVGIDAIYADFTDEEGLHAEALDAVASGWSAKACIHPAQVPVIRRAYAPTAEELEYAQSLLAEVEKHSGVFQFRGAMVDTPLILHAERTVRRAGS